MPISSPAFQDVTTINYTLEWPHLENPSNTTFAGPTQIDICKCGPNNSDLGHMYTRYSCERPNIRFAFPDDELWVLQAPLGQVNLLRPANDEEVQRRKRLGNGTDPAAYAGKNFLLLTGPCPRGRYQTYATLQFLKSLTPLARQRVEYLSLLLQPYEEDCCDDQGGRAYLALAKYILVSLPAFKTLSLNIWGEETRVGSREFAILLWKYGITITISWDWWSGKADEYTEAAAFLEGIDVGVVVKRPVWVGNGHEDRREDGDEGGGMLVSERASESRHSFHENTDDVWEDVSSDEEENYHELDEYHEGNEHNENAHNDNTLNEYTQYEETHDDNEENAGLGPALVMDEEQAHTDVAVSPVLHTSASDDDWLEAIISPLSPGENGSWQML
jgi:hypothetical protein